MPWDMAQARHIDQSAAFARAIEGVAARARADESARAAAGAVPRARRREHAGGARRDGLPDQPAAGTALRPTTTRTPSCRRSSTASSAIGAPRQRHAHRASPPMSRTRWPRPPWPCSRWSSDGCCSSACRAGPAPGRPRMPRRGRDAGGRPGGAAGGRAKDHRDAVLRER